MVTVGLRNLVLLLALLPAAWLQAMDSAAPDEPPLPAAPTSPLEAELLADMADGRLEQFTLLEAALIASRVEQRSRLDECLARFAELSSRLGTHSGGGPTPQQQAAHILQFLHQHVLTGDYVPACTELDRSLETGDYNCVTATVLYRCLSAAWDLPVITLAQPGHVYCRLAGCESPIQTTSPRGLLVDSVGNQREDQPQRGADSRPADAPSPDGGRPLSDVQLVAKIYYNRGVNLLASEAFAAALPLLELACQLDPQDTTARSNVLACMNNWALAECGAGRYEAALRLLAEGVRLEPDYPAFADNDVYIHGCWVRQLCREGRYAEAIELLRAAHQRRPAVELFRRGQTLVYEAWRDGPRATAHAAVPAATEVPQDRADPGSGIAPAPTGNLDGRRQEG